MIYNFDSSRTGAPVLSGTAGALRALLKACLVDGFGAGAVATLTVSAGVATATYAGAHPFAPGRVAEISGATPAELNGKKIVTTTTGSSITFPAPGVPDGSATGTISSKAAAPGWLELFAGALTNVIALKPSVPEATGCVLRVDDTGTTTARLVGYESMDGISSGVGAYPSAVQQSGGVFWPKSDAASSAARPWRMFADERAFALWVAPSGAQIGHGVFFGFGDFISDKSGDAYGCYLPGGALAADVTTSSTAVGACLGYANAAAAASVYVPRAYTGVGGSQAARKSSAYAAAAAYSGLAGYSNQGIPYPNPADNSLRVSRLDLLIGSTGFRGRIPGIYHTPHVVGEAFVTGDLVAGSGEFAGRTLMALRCGPPGAAIANAGCVFVDLTGPWR